MNDMTIYSEIATGMVLVYGPKLIMAIVTLIIGLWIIGFIHVDSEWRLTTPELR